MIHTYQPFEMRSST